MRITNGVEAIDLALYLSAHKTLVFSDFHIGYEAELHKRGVLVPKFQFKDILKRLGWIFAKLRAQCAQLKAIVINGDLKHSFGEISRQEWKETLELIDFLREH